MRLDKIKEKLELLYEEKVKGIVIRATAHWHEYGERSTKYFLNLEKRTMLKTHAKIVNKWFNNYRPLSDTLRTKPFYENLYKTNDSVEASDP